MHTLFYIWFRIHEKGRTVLENMGKGFLNVDLIFWLISYLGIRFTSGDINLLIISYNGMSISGALSSEYKNIGL